MSRKGTPDELRILGEKLRQLYAAERVLLERAAEASIIQRGIENDRRALSARIEKAWALFREQLKSEATGKPMPEAVDLVGTPAMEVCDNCNGAGCAYCGGHGTRATKAARDGAA